MFGTLILIFAVFIFFLLTVFSFKYGDRIIGFIKFRIERFYIIYSLGFFLYFIVVKCSSIFIDDSVWHIFLLGVFWLLFSIVLFGSKFYYLSYSSAYRFFAFLICLILFIISFFAFFSVFVIVFRISP